MALDYSKLRARMVEKYHSVSGFSEHLGVSATSIVAKLNGTRGVTKSDVVLWSKELDIETKDIGDYFFTPKV